MSQWIHISFGFQKIFKSCAITGESAQTSSDNHRMPTRGLDATRMISMAFAHYKLQQVL
jgi:hypothetical protein